MAGRSLRSPASEAAPLAVGPPVQGGFEVHPRLCEAVLPVVAPPASGGCEVHCLRCCAMQTTLRIRPFMRLAKARSANAVPKSTKLTLFVHLPLVYSSKFTISPFLPSHELPVDGVPRPARNVSLVSEPSRSGKSLAEKRTSPSDGKSGKKILRCSSALQGCSSTIVPSSVMALRYGPCRGGPLEPGGNGYEAQAFPPLKGSSTRRGSWEQPAPPTGRPRAPPKGKRQVDLSQNGCCSLSLSLSLSWRERPKASSTWLCKERVLDTAMLDSLTRLLLSAISLAQKHAEGTVTRPGR